MEPGSGFGQQVGHDVFLTRLSRPDEDVVEQSLGAREDSHRVDRARGSSRGCTSRVPGTPPDLDEAL
jgi:hypothetical protein